MANIHFHSTKNCFSTEAKALEFINQYSDDILAQTGYAPVRTYYSESCQAWQVTSKYIAPAGYIKEITSKYDQICRTQNYSRSSLKQTREHQLDALLYFIGEDILKAIKRFGRGDAKKCATLLANIRMHLSFALELDGEDSHKNKIKKFIAAFHMEMENLHEGINDTSMFDKYVEYFGKKHAKYTTIKGQPAGEHSNIKKKIFDCYTLLYNVNSSEKEEYDEAKKAMMDNAMVLFKDIAGSNICRYKRKRLKMEFIHTINACAGAA